VILRAGDLVDGMPVKACHGKVKFPSKKNARARARLLALADGGWWMSYKCRHCRRWHIGHSSRRV
jgi:hypothetical protein